MRRIGRICARARPPSSHSPRLFPVACQVISHGPSFSGLRHFLFVLPPIAVLAGIGFDAMLTWCEARQRALAGRRLRRAGRRVGVASQRDGPAASLRVVCSSTRWSAACTARRSATTPTIGSTACTRWWSNWRTTSTAKSERIPRFYFVAVCGERLAFEKEAEARNGRLRWATDADPADFFHRADPSRLPQRHRRQSDPHGRTHGRADRRDQGPPHDHPAAYRARQLTPVGRENESARRGAGGRSDPERERGYRRSGRGLRIA